MNNLKTIFFSAFTMCFFTWNVASAQQTVAISDGGTINGVSCASSVIITDSGGENGDYGSAEDFTMTICVETTSDAFGQIIISPALNGDVWDLDASSTLFIYDGNSTGAPLLGAFNSITDPAGVNVSGTTGCITLQFVSGAGASGPGFTANFACEQPLQPFNFDISGIPPLEQFQDFTDPAIKICFGDSIIVSVQTEYPLSEAGGNGYLQEDATSFFRYLMGDGTIYQGLGLTQISHTYADPFGYQVTITIQDVNGKVEFKQFYVLSAPRPDFTNLAVDDTLCIGQQTVITGGATATDTVGVDPNTSAILGGGILGEQLFLPDGNDENYETTIVIDEFDDDQVIENATDILSFCVNMEHSFLGDLEMMLTCPDGTSINVFNSFTGDGLFPGGFGGGGTYLGDANDDQSTDPGIGFDYCFSDDAAFGTMGDELAAGNTVPVNTFQAGNAMAPGTYLPEELLETFIGCPINGDWTLTIRDNLQIDNGWIFNWSIFFDPNINPSTVFYSPDIVDVYWEDNDDIVSDDGTSITVEPSVEGNNSFTFVAVDEFGCIHDTTLNVYVRPMASVDDAIACDLTHTLAPENALFGTWTVVSKPSPDAVVVGLNTPVDGAMDDIQVSEYGIYEFLLTELFCSYEATAVIDFRPNPSVAPLVSDTTLCVGSSILLDAGAQAANSGNFNVSWTRDGQVINGTDYAIEADQTGQYIVTITGVCGTASDTTNLVAIDIDYEGNVVCGLQATGDVEVSPEGTGTWSADSPDISFSSINQQITQISSQNYGEYQITYTDDRCVNDGLTLPFRFVQPPVINVLPQNPKFCVDSDVLIITATITGSNNGEFLWSINGAGTTFNNDTLVFDPLYFDPNVGYILEALALDPYEVCAPGTGSTNFTGDWCEYNIPDVVTPNGDGKNDRFHVQYLDLIPGSKLLIYDRWGKQVFESDNYGAYQQSNFANNAPNSGGWDPTDVGTGTYYYELLLPRLGKTESGYVQVLDGEAKE